MATIRFQDYIIEKSVYEYNPSFRHPNEDGELVINDDFKAEVGIAGKKGYVKIIVALGEQNSENESVPFFLKVVIRGVFEYTAEEDEKAELKRLLGSNALAILYPYLRSYITSVTVNSNQFPAYILPVMNFVQLVQDNAIVKFVGFNEEWALELLTYPPIIYNSFPPTFHQQ